MSTGHLPVVLEMQIGRYSRRQSAAIVLHETVFMNLTAMRVLYGTLSSPTGAVESWILPDRESQFTPEMSWRGTVLADDQVLAALGCIEASTVRLTIDARSCSVGPVPRSSLLAPDEVLCDDSIAPGADRILILGPKGESVVRVNRLPQHSRIQNQVRLSAHARHLLGVGSRLNGGKVDPEVTSGVTVMPFRQVVGSSGQDGSRERPFAQRLRENVEYRRRRVVSSIDRMGAVLVGAPEVSAISTRARLGDDFHRIVRVSRDLLSEIGAMPGASVYVRWGEREVLAVLQPDRILDETYDFGAPIGGFDGDFVNDEFRVSLPLAVRLELELPARAIVQIRRRVLSVISGQLNQSIVPLAGFGVAALAVPGVTGLLAGVGFAVVLLLALVPVRHSRAPKGLWR